MATPRLRDRGGGAWVLAYMAPANWMNLGKPFPLYVLGSLSGNLGIYCFGHILALLGAPTRVCVCGGDAYVLTFEHGKPLFC